MKITNNMLWEVNKPVKHFMGDKDKDEIMNMFDCAPRNRMMQRRQHNNDSEKGLRQRRLRRRCGCSYEEREEAGKERIR